MKTKMALLAFAAILLLAPACAKKVTSDTPRGNAALTADAIVVRVNELQATVIQFCGPAPACAPGTIDTNTARDIVQTAIDLRTTLKAVPDGWRATTKAAWNRAKPRFVGVANPAIQAAISAVDVVIGGL